MEISRNDFDQWKVNAVTREVFKVLEERRQKIAHELASGVAITPDAGEYVGRYKEISELLEWTYDDLIPKEAPDEPEGNAG